MSGPPRSPSRKLPRVPIFAGWNALPPPCSPDGIRKTSSNTCANATGSTASSNTESAPLIRSAHPCGAAYRQAVSLRSAPETTRLINPARRALHSQARRTAAEFRRAHAGLPIWVSAGTQCAQRSGGSLEKVHGKWDKPVARREYQKFLRYS